MKSHIKRLINNKYHNITFPYAFGSYRKFSKAFLQEYKHLKLTHKDIKTALDENRFFTLHVTSKKRFKRRKLRRPDGAQIFYQVYK